MKRLIKIIYIVFIVSLLLLMSSCALFNPKYRHLTNENNIIDTETLLNAAVEVEMESYTKTLVYDYKSINYGSGVIFYESSSRYYCLSNNHVVFNANATSTNTYFVTDHLGNRHEAKLEKTNSKYDLSVLSFPKEGQILPIIYASKENPEIKTHVRAIDNYFKITSGYITDYVKAPNLPGSYYTESNVKCEVIESDVSVHHGSSGGALVNDNNELVGIVYAAVFTSNDVCIYSYIIPIKKVLYFLSNL